jgi:hypothetical protein
MIDDRYDRGGPLGQLEKIKSLDEITIGYYGTGEGTTYI